MIKVTKAEYHANKHTGNYVAKAIYLPNLKCFNGYAYYKKA